MAAEEVVVVAEHDYAMGSSSVMPNVDEMVLGTDAESLLLEAAKGEGRNRAPLSNFMNSQKLVLNKSGGVCT